MVYVCMHVCACMHVCLPACMTACVCACMRDNVFAEKEEKIWKDEKKKLKERGDKWILRYHFAVLILCVFFLAVNKASLITTHARNTCWY